MNDGYNLNIRKYHLYKEEDTKMKKDIQIIRELASRYAVIAHDNVNGERIKLSKAVNDLHQIRPVVNIDELPWHELNVNGELTLHCEDPKLRGIEDFFRKELFRWNHFPADRIVLPYYEVRKIVTSTGIGVEVEETTLGTSEVTGSVLSHEYVDQFVNEEDIEKLHCEKLTYHEEETKKEYNFVGELFGDILPIKMVGEPASYGLACKAWDDFVFWRGANPVLMDLIERPEYMHRLMEKYVDIYLDKIRQMEELNLFDTDNPYIHATPAVTDDLPPVEDYQHVKTKNMWGRALAQIFASVSKDMRDEFDIQYMKKAMEPFGLVYYGCCEPLHNQIDILEQIPNLRKITMTPWADVDIGAEAIGKKYVMSIKTSPSYVAVSRLDKEALTKEITHILDAAYRNGCACDITLKDISTVCGRPENLFEWEQTVMDLVLNYR